MSILAAGKVAVLLIGMLMPGLTFLAFGEVAAPLVMHARMPGLLTLREIAAVLLLGGLALLLLAARKSTVLVIGFVRALNRAVLVIAVFVIAVFVIAVFVIAVFVIAHGVALHSVLGGAQLWGRPSRV